MTNNRALWHQQLPFLSWMVLVIVSVCRGVDGAERTETLMTEKEPTNRNQRQGFRGLQEEETQMEKLHFPVHNADQELDFSSSPKEEAYKKWKQLEQAFDKYDEDGTGSLSMNEPKQVVVSPQYWIGSRKKESTLGQDDEVVVELYPHEMPLFDENGNGTLEFPEFWAMVLTAMMSSPSSELNPSSQPVFYKLLQTFDEMDQNDDAVLSASELIAGMVGNKDTDVANETVQTILMETDDNRDGKLSFAEFVELVATMSKPDSYR